MAVALHLRKRVSGLSGIDKGFLVFLVLSATAFLFLPQGSAEVIAEVNIGFFYLVLFAVGSHGTNGKQTTAGGENN